MKWRKFATKKINIPTLVHVMVEVIINVMWFLCFLKTCWVRVLEEFKRSPLVLLFIFKAFIKRP